MKNKFSSYFCNLFAPLRVAWYEKIFFLWPLITAFFGLINLWGAFLTANEAIIKSSLDEGSLFIFSISICAPFISELLFQFLIDKKQKKVSDFVAYKIITILINVVWTAVLCFLWVGGYRNDRGLQIICAFVSLFSVFYMYCVSKMSDYKTITGNYNDIPYLTQEQKQMENLARGLDDLKDKDVGGVKL